MNTIEINGEIYQKIDNSDKSYRLIRGDRSGVFAGYLKEKSEDGKRVVLNQARRIWYWSGAASLSQLAEDGVSNPDNCKFPKEVSEIEITDVIENMFVSEKAKKSISEVKIWLK